MTHPNEEILRMQDKALQSGDIPAVFDAFADDIVVHVSGKSPLAGTFKGKAAVQEVFGKWMQMSGELRTGSHDILANDTHGIVLTEYTAKRAGKTFEGKGVNVSHFNKKGKIAEMWILDLDQYAADAFYSG